VTPTQPRPTLLTRRWREELPGLSDLPILPHQGLAIETAAGTDLLVIGTASAEAIDLVPGQNLVGLQRVPPGLDAAALLTALGDSTVAASVRRDDPATGRFDTLAYAEDGTLAGKPGPGPGMENSQSVTPAMQPASRPSTVSSLVAQTWRISEANPPSTLP
jgi:hypothetical protein